MLRSLFSLGSLLLALSLGAPAGHGFALIGPYAAWMDSQKNYQQLRDRGGPMNLGEEYRYNIPTIYYGFDSTFLNYFGARGADAIDQAVAIINNLPPVSQIDINLFPINSTQINYRASALSLMDVKSTALQALLEQLGLAEPERWTWCLRHAWDAGNGAWNFIVIKRNFDPTTWEPSSYVNGTLYTYRVVQTDPAPEFDAREVQVDPAAPRGNSVAGGTLGVGEFFTGLTRDDVGGLKYLYRTDNYNVENPVTGAYQSTNNFIGIPYYPIGLTNVYNTNNVSTNLTVLRPGIEKVRLVRLNYDTTLGQFVAFTNTWTDNFITNRVAGRQSMERVLATPDIIFTAADLDLVENFPVDFDRNLNMLSNADVNPGAGGGTALDGPGIMDPPIIITFSKLGPSYWNGPGFLTEGSAGFSTLVWGSFDGSTNEPVVYPNGMSIKELEALVRRR